MKFALRGDIMRRSWPPNGGWVYLQPETGWRAPTPMVDTFDSTVTRIIQHRQANHGYQLPTDVKSVGEDLMDQVARRIIETCPEHIEKWVVAMDDDAKKKFQGSLAPLPGVLLGAVAGRASRARSALERILARVRGIHRGATTLAEWIGNGAIPVSPVVADRRATICSGCPKNEPAEGFADLIVGKVADSIADQTIVKNALGLTTIKEDRLGVCEACWCPLRLKVWVPLDQILKHTDKDTIERFHPACWVTNEKVTAVASGSPRPVAKKVLTIQRRAAFGDVILSTILATKLANQGVGVNFITEPIIAAALDGHPDVQGWVSSGTPDVNLDRTYEDNIDKNKKDIALLLLEASEHQLRPHGIDLPDKVNRVPVLSVTDDERWQAAQELERHTGPRIVVVAGSGSWPNRQWAPNQMQAFARKMENFGTLIWSSPKGTPAPEGVRDIGIRSFRHLMAVISQADLVVSPDTGPLHVAAAFEKPIIALEQCNDTRLRLTNLTDWTAVNPMIDCVRCHEFTCPIDAKAPPCQQVSAELVAAAVRAKWAAWTGQKVTAIIPVLHETPRLERCIAAVRNQVDEIIVALDGKASISQRIRNMGVRECPASGERLGYGKTVMRAARHATGRYLLMLNDDCYLDPGAVPEMKVAMDESVAVVGALLRYPNGLVQHAGQFRPPGVIGFGHIDHKRSSFRITEPTDMEAVTFACALLRREAFFSVRGFDELYDCYSEDTDVCLKLIQAGWRVVFQPSATGIHDESQTTNPQKDALLARGTDIFVAKWRHYLSGKKPLI